MHILIFGDSHMDTNNLFNVIDYADTRGCKTLLSVGDYGYWPHIEEGREFLKRISDELIERDMEIHFIKGNHDNHEYLEQFSGMEIAEVSPRMFFRPNMTTWVWGNYTFCSVGGAYSIDGYKRTFGKDKWPNEEISNSDVYTSIGVKADIIISHDCPETVDIDDYLENKRDPMTYGHRMKLQSIVDEIKPQYVIHGHYHERFVARGHHPEGKFTNIGLARNGDGLDLQCLVFDCDSEYHDFTVNSGRRWVEL